MVRGLNGAAIAKGSGGSEWRVEVLEEVGSTNDWVAAAGRRGEAEGLAVFAERQTAGRGRWGRRWDSREGAGLWFSVLLRPGWPVEAVGRLTAIGPLAVAEACESLASVRCGIKWPNDVWIGGRKLAGVLVELGVIGGSIEYAVVGIGVNVDHALEDFPPELRGVATSLRAEGCAVDRTELAGRLLATLARVYRRPFGEIRDDWRRRCITLGRWVETVSGERGLAEDIDEQGCLVVRGERGMISIAGGEIAQI